MLNELFNKYVHQKKKEKNVYAYTVEREDRYRFSENLFVLDIVNARTSIFAFDRG